MSDSFADTLTIQGQLIRKPNVCRFALNHTVYPNGQAYCGSPEMAAGSPLLQEIFALGGIRQILVTERSLTVEKLSDEPWPQLGKKIGALIRKHARPDEPLVGENLHPSPSVQDGVIQREVYQLIKSEINPQIASHGGFVDLDKVESGVVYLRMGGGCQGCSASSLTLKMHIERTIYSHVPEVNDIVDVTDHDAGTNPFYSSGSGPYGG